MADTNMHIIVLQGGAPAHREAVQAIVKVHGEGWWHNLPDVWVVGGKTVTYWRDLITPTLRLSSATVLVLRLPDKGGPRNWAAGGKAANSKNMNWLRTSYSGLQPIVPKTLPAAPRPADDDITS